MNEGTKLALYSAILIGISIVFANAAAKRAEPLLVSSYSLLISSAILFAFVLFSKKKFSDFHKIKNSADFWKIVFSRNIIGISLLTYGLSMTTAVNSLVMLRLEPVFVIIFGYFLLKERVTSKELLFVIAIIAGAMLVSTGGNFSGLGATHAGDLLVIASLVTLGYSYIPTKRLVKKMNPIEMTALSNLAGGAILLAISVFVLRKMTMPIEALYLTAGSAISFHVLGLVFWFKALKTVEAWKVAALLSISPVAGGALAFLWLGESFNTVQLVGAMIVLAVSYILSVEIGKTG